MLPAVPAMRLKSAKTVRSLARQLFSLAPINPPHPGLPAVDVGR